LYVSVSINDEVVVDFDFPLNEGLGGGLFAGLEFVGLENFRINDLD
jgi:hypothetical protein